MRTLTILSALLHLPLGQAVEGGGAVLLPGNQSSLWGQVVGSVLVGALPQAEPAVPERAVPSGAAPIRRCAAQS